MDEIRKLQADLPWTRIWSSEFQGDPRPYAKFQHCLTNIAAQLGNVFQRIERSDHYGMDYTQGLDREEDATALAIIVMSALKAANVYPGGPLDIARFIEADLRRRQKDTNKEIP